MNRRAFIAALGGAAAWPRLLPCEPTLASDYTDPLVTGPTVQSLPGSGVTLTLRINPRCRVGSKWRIVRSLKSMTRPGVNGPTSFILTMTFLFMPSTKA